MGTVVHFGKVAHTQHLAQVENVVLDLLEGGGWAYVGLEHAVGALEMNHFHGE